MNLYKVNIKVTLANPPKIKLHDYSYIAVFQRIEDYTSLAVLAIDAELAVEKAKAEARKEFSGGVSSVLQSVSLISKVNIQ